MLRLRPKSCGGAVRRDVPIPPVSSCSKHACEQARLLDRLVGAGEQHERDIDAKRSSCRLVDNERKFCRQLDRQLGRFGPFENAVKEGRRASVRVSQVDIVGD